MSLDIQQTDREGIAILEMKGRSTVGPEATSLRDRIAELAKAGSVNIILDLKHVAYIDSTGLGALVMCGTTLRKQGGNMKLLNLNRRNIELLIMTKIATVFDLFAD